MKTGQPLIEEINATEVGKNQCAVWWLGQQSFIVKLAGSILYFDPFLSPHERRLVAPLLKPQEVTNADLIFGSHDHRDHLDRPAWPALAQASPAARFVVPEALLPALAKDLAIPLERFIGLDDGRTVIERGLRISAIASAHEFLDRDPATGRYPYLGFVVEADGIAIYHAGDGCIYEGLQTKLRQWKLQMMFLPINGRDAKRLAQNCIGNMTYQEAADLAGALAPEVTVPAHFDMFARNGENPELFVDYMRVKYPRLKVMIFPYGESRVFTFGRVD
ncbi:MAG: MBL fold metallo-hydrolase [Lentisphaerae bacterium]|nr:MBL fold metallo-hydrolase [Lentisphaerota bacterium]